MGLTILLLSGGIESTALAFQLRPDLCLTVDYGQLPFEGELRASDAICRVLELRHEVLRTDISTVGVGVMAGRESVARSRSDWPFRNQFLITLAAMRAASLGGAEVVIGTVKTDRIHSDGRPGFLNSLNHLVSRQAYGVTVSAPAMRMTTVGLLRRSKVPVELISWTTSCHVSEWSCGECEGCAKRAQVLRRWLGKGRYQVRVT